MKPTREPDLITPKCGIYLETRYWISENVFGVYDHYCDEVEYYSSLHLTDELGRGKDYYSVIEYIEAAAERSMSKVMREACKRFLEDLVSDIILGQD